MTPKIFTLLSSLVTGSEKACFATHGTVEDALSRISTINNENNRSGIVGWVRDRNRIVLWEDMSDSEKFQQQIAPATQKQQTGSDKKRGTRFPMFTFMGQLAERNGESWLVGKFKFSTVSHLMVCFMGMMTVSYIVYQLSPRLIPWFKGNPVSSKGFLVSIFFAVLFLFIWIKASGDWRKSKKRLSAKIERMLAKNSWHST